MVLLASANEKILTSLGITSIPLGDLFCARTFPLTAKDVCSFIRES